MTTEPNPVRDLGPYNSVSQVVAQVRAQLHGIPDLDDTSSAEFVIGEGLVLSGVTSTLTPFERDQLAELARRAGPVLGQQVAAWIVRAYLLGLSSLERLGDMDAPCNCGECPGTRGAHIQAAGRMLGVDLKPAPEDSATFAEIWPAVAGEQPVDQPGPAQVTAAAAKLDAFTRDVVDGVRWAIEHNEGDPAEQWPRPRQAAVALVMGNHPWLGDIGYSVESATRRIAAELEVDDIGPWIRTVREMARRPDPEGRTVEAPAAAAPAASSPLWTPEPRPRRG